MAMPMPPLNIASSSSASSGLETTGNVFNFGPPTAKQSQTIIIAIAAIVALFIVKKVK